MRRVGLIAAILVGAAGVYALFRRSLVAARGRLVGRSETMETSFGVVEYAVMGQGAAMLVVHGAAGGFDQGLDMTGALAEVGYRLVAPSRFGYLRSSMPAQPTCAKQADAFAELLEVIGVDRVVVVGISAGAWSCLQFATRHPDRCLALVLLVPANALPAGTTIHGGALTRAIINSDFIAWAFRRLTPILPAAMTRVMLGTDPALVRHAEPSEKARVRQILDHLLPVGARIAGMNFDVRSAASPEPCHLGEIRCPVLTISAEDDPFDTAVRARSIAAHVSGGKAVIYPTGGHALVGRYADALCEVTAFIRRLGSSRF